MKENSMKMLSELISSTRQLSSQSARMANLAIWSFDSLPGTRLRPASYQGRVFAVHSLLLNWLLIVNIHLHAESEAFVNNSHHASVRGKNEQKVVSLSGSEIKRIGYRDRWSDRLENNERSKKFMKQVLSNQSTVSSFRFGVNIVKGW